MIDVNVNLSRWPFRRLAGDEPAALVAELRKRNVVQAWAASFDGIFHKDLASANARLANDCRRSGDGILLPFGSVNPILPDWQEDLRRCHEEHRMPGIRLHPNYHGYTLNDSVFAELLRSASARKVLIQIAASMEDERTQHPLMRVPPVDLSPLADLLERVPGARLVVLNFDPEREKSRKLLSQPGVSFDISMVEGVGGVARLAKSASIQRLLFGSHCPLFYLDSAVLKVRESGFSEEEENAILTENARRLLRA